jgi:diacylglycerol kinase (ATP)
MHTLYFIVNPEAGNRSCLKTWVAVEAELQRKEVQFHAFFTNNRGHAKEITEQLAKKQGQIVIIAVGGDGTLHEVVNGVAKYKNTAIGFIPGGSGNDFSRGFNIPKDPVSALHYLLKIIGEQPHLIDCGKVTNQKSENHFFINNMGVGFDALISYDVNTSGMKSMLNKLSMGRLVYVYYLLKNLFTYRRTNLDLTIDGIQHSFENSWFVTVSNQPFYGGGMKIAPDAIPTDGLLDITVVHNLSRIKLLLVFISVFWGKHIHFEEVKSFKGKEISIQSSEPVYAHADGEHIGSSPLKTSILPKALSVTLSGKKATNTNWGEEEIQ